MSSDPPRPRFKPEPIETTTRSSRGRFAPEPIEAATRSSRKPTAEVDTPPTKKRFLPQPIATSTRSSKDGPPGNTSGSGRSRFAPQLVETSTRTSRDVSGNFKTTVAPDSEEVQVTLESAVSVVSPQPRRKFTPELLGTATRSRRTQEKQSPTPKTKTSPRLEPSRLDSNSPSKFLPTSPKAIASPPLSKQDCRRLGIPIPQRQPSTDPHGARVHCFRVPDLDPIESSESEEETDPSRQPSPSSASEQSERSYNHATRRRESVDKGSSGYLLELAAKAAERQLREQVLAAFPNDDRHTYVDHFIGDVSEQTSVAPSLAPSRASSVTNFHRQSSGLFRTDPSYRDMQKHQQRMASQREREKNETEGKLRRTNKPAGNSPWSSPFAKLPSQGPDRFGNTPEKTGEMERMRNRARPPMLGKDMKFPRCPSPEPARFDVTQGSQTLRNQMCYLTEQSQQNSLDKSGSGSGLWSAKKTSPSIQCSTWSRASSQSPSTGGLWGGFCHESTALPAPVQTGLLTPRPEEEGDSPVKSLGNPASGSLLRYNRSSPSMLQLPPSPPPSNSGMARLDEKLELEQAIEEEFDDAFVTQVYNYLSLGYPSLARRFDDELSKISRIPVAELRQDDHIATSRGYIRLGEDEMGGEEGISEENCVRWKALREYVHEWARQQPFMEKGQGFGLQTAARRGSWAW